MRKLYRIKKQQTKKIFGPFSLKEVASLALKKRISSKDSYQMFPGGEWEPIQKFSELKEILLSTRSNEDEGGEFTVVKHGMIQKIKEEKLKQKEKEEMKKEFTPQKSDVVEFKVNFDQNIEEEIDAAVEKELEKEKEEIVEQVEEVDMDRTIVNPDFLKFPQQEIEKQAEESESSEQIEITEETQPEIVPEEDQATVVAHIGDLVPDLKGLADLNEKELLAEEFSKAEEENIEAEETEEENNSEAKKKPKKKSRPVILVVMVLVILFVLFDEEEKPKTMQEFVQYAEISFPITKDYIDEVKSKAAFQQGVAAFNNKKYKSQLAAAKAFRISLEHKFKNNPALGYLVESYAALIENTKDPTKSSSTIFRLMKLGRTKLLNDIHLVLGVAQFYGYFKKYRSGIRVIENFIRLNKPSLRLFGIYLQLLVKSGQLIKAEKVYETLSGQEKLPLIAFAGILEYLKANQLQDEIFKYLKMIIKQHGKRVWARLMIAEFYIQQGMFKELQEEIKIIQKLRAEGAPSYYAYYLRLRGIEAGVGGKPDVAAKYFSKALQIHESDELRIQLSELQLGGGNLAEKIITDSKVVRKMYDARKMMREAKWEEAFILAIDAVDLNGESIPAQLLLTEIQVERGYLAEAILKLEDLYQSHSKDARVVFPLIRAYCMAYRFIDAKKIFSIVGSSDLRKTYEYASAQAFFYAKKELFNFAVKWYQQAIKRNPLNDREYYELAHYLLKHRKFKEGKRFLASAIELDPVNVEYRSLYAQILYEMDSVDTAIGYLRDFLKDYPDDPVIMSRIAIYYYKSGQIKPFEQYKKKLEELPRKDISFYQFMLESAQIDERVDDVILYSREIIRLSPGNLEARMVVSEYLINQERYDEALKMLLEIKMRLDVYPKLHYFLAKVYIAKGDYDKALEYAEIEVKNNEKSIWGLTIVGDIYFLQKKYLESTKYYEKAISVNPKSEDALMGLADIKRKQNYLNIAQELYVRVLKENPNNARAHRDIGYVYRGIGQGSLAIESFKTYLDLLPNAKDKAIIEQIIRQLQ